MNNPIETQLYLATPPLSKLDVDSLVGVLADGGIACLYVSIAEFVEAETPALENLCSVAADAECALVLGGDDTLALELAVRFAVDGVHLTGSPKQIDWARKQLGKTAIVGYGAGTSRPNALVAAESGADYVSLGPLAELEPDLLSWWQAVIETPIVVEGVALPDEAQNVRSIADFILVPASIWSNDAPTQIARLKSALSA